MEMIHHFQSMSEETHPNPLTTTSIKTHNKKNENPLFYFFADFVCLVVTSFKSQNK